MPTPTSNVWRMADRLAGGNLAKTIRTLDQRDLSPEQIARELYANHGVDVTRQTITNWLKALDAKAPEGDAA